MKDLYPAYDVRWKCSQEEYEHFKRHVSLGCSECERIDKLLEESGFD